MANKKPAIQTILHATDTISDIIYTVSSVKNDTLIYIPEDMYMLYNPINRKLLAREVLSQKKYQIQFFSPDHHLIDLLRDEHLEATTSENIHLPEPNNSAETDPFADFFRYDTITDFDTVSATNENTHRMPEKKSGSHTSHSSSWRYILIGIVFALLIAGSIGVVIVPRATITLTQSGEVFTQDFEVTFDTTISEIDTTDNRVPLYRKEVTREITEEFEATGTSESGTRARATILVRNESSSEQPLVSNTRFLSDNQKQFRTTSAITVPAQGTVEVEIIADETGEEYNIEPGRLTIPGLASSGARARQIYGDLRTQITNGSSDNQSIITQEDIDNIQDSLREQMSQSLNEDLEESATDGRVRLERTQNVLEIEFTDLPSVGMVADTVTVTGISSMSGYVYEEEQLQSLIRNNIRGQLLEGNEIADTLTISFDDLSENSENGKIRTRVYVEYSVLSEINEESVQHALKGKSLSALETYVNENDSISEASIEIQPSILPWFPLLGRNISVIIES